jgi:(R,R)-butanediol dehydrogenase / meso-butanediol dehydrogenase / diacetyl reductase
MLAAVIEGPGAVVVRDTAPPRAAGLALVRVTQAGICGTDRTLAAGGIAVRPPRVLGHEMTGRVEVPAAGGAVPAGTPVVVNPAAFCGACRECRRGLPNLCARGGLLGRDLDGGFAEHVAVPESLLHPLPVGITADEAYLKELTIRCPRASRPADFDAAIGLCAERRVALAPLITGRFPLGEVAQALPASERPEHLKIVLDVAGP